MLKGLFYFGFSVAYLLNGVMLFITDNMTMHIISLCVLSIILTKALNDEGT